MYIFVLLSIIMLGIVGSVAFLHGGFSIQSGGKSEADDYQIIEEHQ